MPVAIVTEYVPSATRNLNSMFAMYACQYQRVFFMLIINCHGNPTPIIAYFMIEKHVAPKRIFCFVIG
jgi:hypothetical protein